MIPEFPQFKKLELSDKEAVEAFTSKFPPYSDFNFVSLWSWNIKDEMRLSVLNNNLVVHFRDYLTNEPFYSFLGNNEVTDTVTKLLELSKKEGLEPKLKLVPEDSIKNIESSLFKVEEDRDNFDYIYDLNILSKYNGSDFIKKRNKVKQFLKLFPNARVETIDITNPDINKKILELDELWLKNKNKKDSNLDMENEFWATNRFLQLNFTNTFGVGIFLDNKLSGYSIISNEPNNYVTSHFTKADTQFAGIYDFLMREIAKILIQKKYYLMNFEQDLGLSGLRKSKQSFTSNYLKKYLIKE